MKEWQTEFKDKNGTGYISVVKAASPEVAVKRGLEEANSFDPNGGWVLTKAEEVFDRFQEGAIMDIDPRLLENSDNSVDKQE